MENEILVYRNPDGKRKYFSKVSLFQWILLTVYFITELKIHHIPNANTRENTDPVLLDPCL